MESVKGQVENLHLSGNHDKAGKKSKPREDNSDSQLEVGGHFVCLNVYTHRLSAFLSLKTVDEKSPILAKGLTWVTD